MVTPCINTLYLYFVWFQAFSYVSDIGGMLGLWVGLSSLSFIQIIEFVGDVLLIVIRKLRNNGRPRSVEPSKQLQMETSHGRDDKGLSLSSAGTSVKEEHALTPVNI